MDTRTKSCRILMLPWLSHDHILPFLDLAKLLSHKNICIHVCTTTANLNFLKQSLSEKDSISIKLVELQLQLPSSLTTTDGLKEAVEVAKPRFHKILLTLRPDLVLYDFLHSWAPVVAGTQNIPAVLFLSTGAALNSYILHSKCCPTAEYPFPAIFCREDQDELSKFNPTVDSERLLHSIEKSSNMVLIRTSRSMEEKYIDYLSVLSQKKMVPVGSLAQVPEDKLLPPRMIEWLDKKGHGSTVLVSLGTEYLSSTEEMEQISLGLKLSGANFIWASKQALPEGFLKEAGERAMIAEACDLHSRILSHSSVGGFVCRCRWRSVMEGIKFGVPIIALPTSHEEALNARLVEEIGAGKEAVRNKEGHIEKQELERVITEMLLKKQTGADKFLQELGMKLKENEEEEMDDAVEEMEKLCKKVDRLNSLDDMLVQYKS